MCFPIIFYNPFTPVSVQVQDYGLTALMVKIILGRFSDLFRGNFPGHLLSCVHERGGETTGEKIAQAGKVPTIILKIFIIASQTGFPGIGSINC
jgi:hypothetical protein